MMDPPVNYIVLQLVNATSFWLQLTHNDFKENKKKTMDSNVAALLTL